MLLHVKRAGDGTGVGHDLLRWQSVRGRHEQQRVGYLPYRLDLLPYLVRSATHHEGLRHLVRHRMGDARVAGAPGALLQAARLLAEPVGREVLLVLGGAGVEGHRGPGVVHRLGTVTIGGDIQTDLELDLSAVFTASLQSAFQGRRDLRRGPWDRPDWMAHDAVRDLGGQAHERLAKRRDPDRQGGAKRRGGGQPPEHAEIVLVVHAFVGRQLTGVRLADHHANDLDYLPHVLKWLAVGHAVDLLAQSADATAQPEDEAPFADPVHIHSGKRRFVRAPREGEGDTGEQADPARGDGRSGQGDERRAVELRREQPIQSGIFLRFGQASQRRGWHVGWHESPVLALVSHLVPPGLLATDADLRYRPLCR